MSSVHFRALKVALIPLLIWTALIVFSYLWNAKSISGQIMGQAYAEAKTNLNKDITFRRWGTEHGGVYVPITNTQQSVPWLDHIPDRDVVTTGGLKLTLLNPATMLHQMMDAYAEAYGVRERITGLKQLNPNNKPDQWETDHLQAFDRGESKEVWAEVEIDGEPYLRYLRAMYMEPGCDKCHGILGYKTGDMRGAIGLNLPLSPYFDMIDESEKNLLLTYLSIWLLIGMLMVTFGYLTIIQRSEKARRDQERLKSQKALRIYGNAFESSGDAILIADSKNRIFDVNSAFVKMTGYTLQDVRGRRTSILSSGETETDVYTEMWRRLTKFGFWSGELWNRRKSGENYPVWTSITLVTDRVESESFYIANYRDISEQKEVQAQISHLAHHDVLTGLSNRYSLEERLGQAMLSCTRAEKALAVIFIDLDRFKNINDSLGHQAGDQFLVKVADRLRTCVREEDIVARIGGDEFVIVITGLQEQRKVSVIAEKLMRVIHRPYQLNSRKLETTASIGVCLYPNDALTVADLLKNADVAMYQAKARGGNNYQFFSPVMSIAANERLELEYAMRSALKQGRFELYFQPQLDSVDRSLCGVEALLRWNDPSRGMVPPDKFIPIAEETGFIIPLGEWVLEQACRKLSELKLSQDKPIKVAVNISVRQLQSDALVSTVARLMEQYEIEENELQIEITESAAMQEPEFAAHQLTLLSNLGVQLAIDDFGTGHSSLVYLKRLPIHTLKLDRTFVGDIGADEGDEEICIATISLAHSLGLKVIAEGVETREQMKFLVSHRCDYLQGFLFSKPLSEPDLDRFIERERQFYW
ncbi:EAL domain-containing protein [Ferrimonas futtsuensis]|uniref:EAL domain-containing protein n=1 Tax=Ferrimonas futtsuensis TaxID=364764 RepID=UPI00068407BC|nr:EAL domain-containing protein [Ferrimonas futtsuensis]